MRRREFLLGGAGVLGAWAVGTDRLRAREGSNTQPPPRLLRFPMSDGASIAVEAVGSGPSVLLIHGAAGTRKSWARVAPLLQSHFQTFAMNRRGRGDSIDGSTFSLRREAQDVSQVCDRLPDPVYVVAHSYGAIAALEALRLTVKIQRCILYEPPLPVTGGMGRTSPDAVCRAVAAGDNERAMVTFFSDYAQLRAPVIDAFRADPSWAARVQLAPTVCREIQAVSTFSFEPLQFARIATPALFLLGGASPQAMATSVRTGAAALPRGQVHILPDQQHDAMYTAPDLLAAVIADFLTA